jgi:hypothetical protein
MNSNYWESTVYEATPLGDLERCDASSVFDWLGLHFPVDGSKIDWHRVHGRHSHYRVTDDAQLVSLVSREVSSRLLPGSVVEHVGDGLSPFGVRFTADNALSVVAGLLEIPEHHYFLAGDRSWIVVVATEGDVDIVDQLLFEQPI